MTDSWVNETLYAAWGQRFRVVRELPQDGGTIQVAERLLDGTVPPPPAGDGQ